MSKKNIEICKNQLDINIYNAQSKHFTTFYCVIHNKMTNIESCKRCKLYKE